jgi:hypothetical protein|tara:strand:+ start:7409 stop:8695 length:1287 start_codon:yes stop_codon:yes gene_type:complete
MAENLETPSFGNFSIENTMEMGPGSAELLSDLLSPETSTSSPDQLQEIVKEATPPEAPKTPDVPKGKEVVPKEDGKDLSGQELISSFLGDNSGTEEDAEDADPQPVKKKAPAAEAKPAEQASEEPAEEGEDELSQFTALSRDLLKLGVFSQDDEEEEINISTPEEFLARFQEEKKKGAIEVVNNFIGQFGEDYQQAFEAIFVKGVNPKEYFGTYNNVVSFADMDLSQENNQVSVIKQALADQGFETEDINTEVERLKNYGDLESVATKHHKVLVKKEAQKLAQMEQKAEVELQQKQAVKNQYINNVQQVLQDKLKSKEFDGIPLNPKLANELQDFLLVDKYKTASGETLTDFDRTILELKRPENHATKVKVALLLKILEKDPTLSTIQKTGVTKKSNELFGEVARQVTKAKSSTSNGSQPSKQNSWFL